MALSAMDLARLFGGALEGDPPDGALGAVVTDSRQASGGGVFVALRGDTEDGHAYVPAAAGAGAAVVVVDRTYRLPPGAAAPPALLRVDDTAAALRRACELRLRELGCAVVGITGSVGKTTAKEMVALALGGLDVARTPGNLNTWTGIPTTVLGLEPPLDVFVAEMAMSAGGEIRDLTSFTHPSTGVLLNVGLAHVGLLGSIEAIADAKAELIEALPRDGLAVCNADDAMVRRVAPRSGAPVAWFGLRAEDAVYRAADIAVDGLRGTTCRLVGPDGEAPLRLAVPGEHAVVDACAAAAVAGRFGIGIAQVADRLAAFRAPQQRGVVLDGHGGAVVYDDSYNSSPASLAAALDVLRHSGGRRRVAVVGDILELGDHAETVHRDAGTMVAGAATTLVAVGEHAALVVDAAVAAGLPAEEALAVPDALAAVEPVLQRCGEDTVVLVKGSHGIALERLVERITR